MNKPKIVFQYKREKEKGSFECRITKIKDNQFLRENIFTIPKNIYEDEITTYSQEMNEQEVNQFINSAMCFKVIANTN